MKIVLKSKRRLTFPDDFFEKPHKFMPHTIHYVDSATSPTISILSSTTSEIDISVAGGGWAHGNGSTTFEMFDLRKKEPLDYLTKEEINDYLQKNPL